MSWYMLSLPVNLRNVPLGTTVRLYSHLALRYTVPAIILRHGQQSAQRFLRNDRHLIGGRSILHMLCVILGRVQVLYQVLVILGIAL